MAVNTQPQAKITLYFISKNNLQQLYFFKFKIQNNQPVKYQSIIQNERIWSFPSIGNDNVTSWKLDIKQHNSTLSIGTCFEIFFSKTSSLNI